MAMVEAFYPGPDRHVQVARRRCSGVRREDHTVSGDDDTSPPDAHDQCVDSTCSRDAAFWLYEPAEDRWRSICERHARHVHPSLEVHAWLESGYMVPFELGRPDGPPVTPQHGRGIAFREAVEDVLEQE